MQYFQVFIVNCFIYFVSNDDNIDDNVELMTIILITIPIGRFAAEYASFLTWLVFYEQKIVWPLGNPNGTHAKWTKFSSHGTKAPECRETVWSRDNHLGNGKGGFTNKYDWILPEIEEDHCILRIRYCNVQHETCYRLYILLLNQNPCLPMLRGCSKVFKNFPSGITFQQMIMTVGTQTHQKMVKQKLV